MRLAVIGPPGSGREDVAAAIAALLDVPKVGMVDVIQAEFGAGTSAAIQAQQHMNAGELVPEEVLLTMVRARLARPDTRAGFVLDGFPNHAVTAVAVDALLSEFGAPVDRVIDLALTDSEVLRRLTGRRLCRVCGRVWHTEFVPPARPGICDGCGGELFQRLSDSAERITGALPSYRSAAAVTLSHYRLLGKLVSIDATLPTAEIAAKAVGQ